MGLLIGLLIGGVAGYFIKSLGVKTLIADLQAEIARLRGTKES